MGRFSLFIGQYNAWCRSNGSHFTLKRGNVNWNQELLWKMRTELDFQWEVAEDELGRIFSELQETLASHLRMLKSHIGSIKLSPLQSKNLPSLTWFLAIRQSAQLTQAIELQIDALQFKFDRAQQGYTQELRFVHE
jgi:hypothetical protein